MCVFVCLCVLHEIVRIWKNNVCIVSFWFFSQIKPQLMVSYIVTKSGIFSVLSLWKGRSFKFGNYWFITLMYGVCWETSWHCLNIFMLFTKCIDFSSFLNNGLRWNYQNTVKPVKTEQWINWWPVQTRFLLKSRLINSNTF